MVVNMEHDSGRCLTILVKEALQHVHDKFHRRVVIVEEKHPIQVRALCLRLGLGDNGSAGGARLAAPPTFVVR
jgi:hypothetical protein